MYDAAALGRGASFSRAERFSRTPSPSWAFIEKLTGTRAKKEVHFTTPLSDISCRKTYDFWFWSFVLALTHQ